MTCFGFTTYEMLSLTIAVATLVVNILLLTRK